MSLNSPKLQHMCSSAWLPLEPSCKPAQNHNNPGDYEV